VAGQLVAQLRLIQVAGSKPVRLEQRFAVERPPNAVRAAGQIGDDHVRVQVRILRARGAVLVGGGDEPGPALAHHAVLSFAGHARIALEVGERRLPGRQVRLVDRVPNLRASERVEEAHAFRRREDEVVTSDRRERPWLQPPLPSSRVDRLDRDHPLRRMPAEHGGGERITPVDQPPKLPLLNDAVKLELHRSQPCPHAGRLTSAGVVVLQPARDRALVVRLLTGRQL